jgi:hypothetical protein
MIRATSPLIIIIIIIPPLRILIGVPLRTIPIRVPIRIRVPITPLIRRGGIRSRVVGEGSHHRDLIVTGAVISVGVDVEFPPLTLILNDLL